MIKVANNQEPPTEEVLNLKKQGLSDEDIINNLKSKNFTSQQISDAMSQAGIKSSVDEGEMEAPAPGEAGISSIIQEGPGPSEAPEMMAMPTMQQAMPAAKGGASTEMMEELVESVVNEKWEDLMASMGNIALWKENVNTNIRAIKQEIIRVSERFDNLQRAVLGKVSEYDKNIIDMGSEVRALEKVMEKIIEPLTENVKELSKITQQFKEKAKK